MGATRQFVAALAGISASTGATPVLVMGSDKAPRTERRLRRAVIRLVRAEIASSAVANRATTTLVREQVEMDVKAARRSFDRVASEVAHGR